MILRERLVKPLSWTQMSASYIVPTQCKIVLRGMEGCFLLKSYRLSFLIMYDYEFEFMGPYANVSPNIIWTDILVRRNLLSDHNNNYPNCFLDIGRLLSV